MEKKVKFVLVGCGRVSGRHVDALRKAPGAEIVAVCDPVPSQTEKYEKLLGVPAFRSTEEMYKSGLEFDIVDVATPSGDHYARVMEALFHGKHVITEKPVALRLAHVDEMYQEAERRGLKFWVVFQNRYNPAIKKTREVLDEGRLGKPVLGTVRLRWCREQSYYDSDDWHGTWAMDGGVLSQQAIHHLDALQWLMGEVETVSSICTRRLVDMECEDLAVATLRFKNGALGVIEATTAVRPADIEASVSLIGEGGSIVLGGVGINNIEKFEFVKKQPGDAEVPKLHSQEVPNGYGWGHDDLFKDVVKSIQGLSPVRITGRDARKSLELLHAIYASNELGREVRMDEKLESKLLGIRA